MFKIEVNLVKVLKKEYEGRVYYKARVIDKEGEVYDLGVEDEYGRSGDKNLQLINVPVVVTCVLKGGQFNRATVQLVGIEEV